MIIYTNLRDLTPEFQQYRLKRVNQDAAFERASAALVAYCAEDSVIVTVRHGSKTQVCGGTRHEKFVANAALQYAQFDF